jgi:hypothetical protein
MPHARGGETLGDDTGLDDTVLANETVAAMRELADTVTGAPPLRLTPAPSPHRSPRRRWFPWLTPLAAGAVVITLAVALVTLRNMPNGPVVPAAGPTVASDTVPTYYAELVQEPGGENNPDEIQVRQTLTGHLVATVNPPPGAIQSPQRSGRPVRPASYLVPAPGRAI